MGCARDLAPAPDMRKCNATGVKKDLATRNRLQVPCPHANRFA
jgi:hypothetical protein